MTGPLDWLTELAMEIQTALQFVFPLYSYLIEPGPRPAALRDTTTGTLYVPLWTRRDRFDEFVANFEFDGPICGLKIDDRFELTDFLNRFHHPALTQVAIDPKAEAWLPCTLHDIDQVLRDVNRMKPR